MKHLPKVFVVDDDTAVLESLEAVLTQAGYAVACFTSAKDFRETMKAGYQLIFRKALTEEQIRSILELDQNHDSAGYQEIFG